MHFVIQMFLRRRRQGLFIAIVFLLLFLVLIMVAYVPGTESEPSSPGVACPHVSFSPSPLLRTALASFPGSGNTWLRHLLEKLTGIYTGSVYFDVYLYNKGFKGENKTDRSILVVKTHRNLNLTKVDDDPVYERVILLLRNPYEGLLADFRRLYSVGRSHTGNVNIDTFCAAWEDYFTEHAVLLRTFYLSWMLHGNIHLIFYEDLLKDLRKELVRTLHFLNPPSPFAGNIQCALDNSQGYFRRKHLSNMPVDFFYSPRKKEILNQLIREIKENLTERFPRQAFDIMKTWIK